MTRITPRRDAAALRGLLERAPRATVAFTDGDRLDAVPAAFRYRDGRYWIGITPHEASAPQPGATATLVVDDGWYWFELRGVYVRGPLTPAPPADPAPPGLQWFEVAPRTTAAWDYGTLHEEQADAAR